MATNILTLCTCIGVLCLSSMIRCATVGYGILGRDKLLSCSDQAVGFDPGIHTVKWVREKGSQSAEIIYMYRFNSGDQSHQTFPMHQGKYFSHQEDPTLLGINNTELADEDWSYNCRLQGGGSILHDGTKRLVVTDPSKGHIYFDSAKYTSTDVNSKTENLHKDQNSVKLGSWLKINVKAENYRPPATLMWHVDGKPIKHDGINVRIDNKSSARDGGYGDAQSSLEYKVNREGNFNISCGAFGPQPQPQLWNMTYLGFPVKVGTQYTVIGGQKVEDNSSLSVVVIILVVVIVLLILLILVFFIIVKWKRRNKKATIKSPEEVRLNPVEANVEVKPTVHATTMTDSVAEPEITSKIRHLAEIEEKFYVLFSKINAACFNQISTVFNMPSEFGAWLGHDTCFKLGPLEGWNTVRSIQRGQPVFSFYSLLTVAKFPDYFEPAVESERLMYSNIGLLYTLNIQNENDIMPHIVGFLKKHDFLGIKMGLSTLLQAYLYKHKFDSELYDIERKTQDGYIKGFQQLGIVAKNEYLETIPTLVKKATIGRDKPVQVFFHHYYAIRFESWPESATEWKSRSSRKAWPPHEIVLSVGAMPCYLLLRCEQSVESKRAEQEKTLKQDDSFQPTLFSMNQYIEAPDWFLSFAVAEKVLAATLTMKQRMCFLAFKLIYYTKLVNHKEDDPVLDENDVIPYDIPMTVMFRFLEENDTSFWDSPLTETVRGVLRQLLASLECESPELGHYFLADIDILEGHLERDMLLRTTDVLQRIIQDEDPLQHIDADKLSIFVEENA